MSDFASLLVAARRSGERLTLDPRLAPSSLEAAYEIQSKVAERLGARVAGWKVGVSPQNVPFAAPIFDCDVRPNGAAVRLGAEEPAKIEIELALRLGRDLDARSQPYTRDEMLDATQAVLVGIEIVGSRLRAAQDAPFEALLADNFNNAGYVTGDASAEFRSLVLSSLRVRLWSDGVLRQDRTGGHPMGDPLLPAVEWATRQGDRLGGLRAGQFITTGTLTIPLPMTRGARLEGSLEGVGTVSAAFDVDA